jgi:hypothetical protein
MSAAPIATAKVLPAGWTSGGHLRAIVTVTPVVDGDLAEATLMSWPSAMLDWLRHSNWEFCLTVQAAVIRSGTDASWHWAQPDMRSREQCGRVRARALTARMAWEKEKPTWLDQLWYTAITGAPGPNKDDVSSHDAFQALVSALQASVKGDAMKGNCGLKDNQPIQPRPAKNGDPTVVGAVAGNSASITVETVVPSQQSDLAILFEIKRAQELCSTINAAHGETEAYLKTERACIAASTSSTNTKNNVSAAAGHQHYIAAAANVRSTYGDRTGARCSLPARNTDPPVTLPQAPEDVAQKERPEIEEKLKKPLASYSAATQRQWQTVSPKTDACARKDEDKDLSNTVPQKYFAIQGSPALSRLFALTFDVELSMDEVQSALPPDDQHLVAPDKSMFLLLGLDPSILCENSLPCDVFTLAKYRADGARHFFPLSRAEVQLTANPGCESDLPWPAGHGHPGPG